MPAISAAEMAAVDRLAVDGYGITVLQMMELAGSSLAEVVRWRAGGDLRGRRVVVAAGSGNNGGGGMAAARHLADRGASVRVVLSSPVGRSSDAARHQIGILLAMGVSCRVATYDLTEDELASDLGRADVVVDAILGYGARGAPSGDAERLARHVAACGSRVVSLDLPTGVDPDTGSADGVAVTSDATLTLALPKRGLLTPDGIAAAGRLFLGDLGLPSALYAALGLVVGTIFAAGPVIELDALT